MIPFLPTQQLQIGDRVVRVTELAREFRQDVAMYDEIRQRQQKLMIELEIVNLALTVQHGKISDRAEAMKQPGVQENDVSTTADGDEIHG